MGLDMYLMSRSKIYNDVKEEIYWRKANQIRGWFVRNTSLEENDNCKEIPVTTDDLVKLLEDCRKVLVNHELADEIFPPTSGFFFGNFGHNENGDYDEFYYEDLMHTYDELNRILEWVDDETNDFYYTDWW